MNITVYLGATEGNDPALITAVKALGTWIGSNGHSLVYGGSRCGLMGMLAQSVLEAFSGHGIVAYNIGFDRPFLTHKLEKLGMQWPSDNPTIDPLVFARHLWPNQRNKLGMVAERLNVSLVGAHRACNDAEATGKVLYAMRDKLPPDLENLLIIQAQWDLEYKERYAWRNKFKGEDNGLNSLVSPSSAQTLGPGYFFGNETDPLKSLYHMVPSAQARTT